MRSYVEAGAIIAASGSAIFWFMSAMCRLPTMKPGADEIDHGELSKVLHRMKSWHLRAAEKSLSSLGWRNRHLPFLDQAFVATRPLAQHVA